MPVVGKNVPHDSARGHVTGESIYIDMPFAANELLVDFYYSPVAHGKIQSLDLSAAQQIEGVAGLTLIAIWAEETCSARTFRTNCCLPKIVFTSLVSPL